MNWNRTSDLSLATVSLLCWRGTLISSLLATENGQLSCWSPSIPRIGNFLMMCCASEKTSEMHTRCMTVDLYKSFLRQSWPRSFSVPCSNAVRMWSLLVSRESQWTTMKQNLLGVFQEFARNSISGKTETNFGEDSWSLTPYNLFTYEPAVVLPGMLSLGSGNRSLLNPLQMLERHGSLEGDSFCHKKPSSSYRKRRRPRRFTQLRSDMQCEAVEAPTEMVLFCVEESHCA